MALPPTGALSLNAIHIEAGGASGTLCSINDADIRALIGKASGATMSFNEWYGASNLTINFNGGTTYASSLNTAVASVQFNSTGSMTVSGTGYSNIGWASPTSTGLGAGYELRATRTSGSATGTTGTWLSLSSNRGYTLTSSNGLLLTSTFLFEIRAVGTTTVIDSETITLQAESFGGGGGGPLD